MNKTLKKWLYCLSSAGVALALCVACSEPDDGSEAPDVCEEAARHRQSCLGDYVTPPPCDEAAAAAAERLLAIDCSELDQLDDPAKVDGAFCDWFGLGCTADEAIFDGPACSSDAQCGAGYCLEQHCFDGVTSDAFAATLDTWTRSAEDFGSVTRLLVSNSETRAARRTLIENARHSLHFSAFIIEDDETGAEMSALFSAAAQRGVEVRVIVDATTQYTFSAYERLWAMRDAGVQILVFNAVTEWAGLRMSVNLSANDRLHEKLLIADGTEAIMGGRNVGEDYLLDGKWRDTDVYVAGPGVFGIQRMFLTRWDQIAAWEKQAGCPNRDDYDLYCPDGVALLGAPAYYQAWQQVGGAGTRAIHSDPSTQETPLGYLATLALIRAAGTSITLANSYFVPPRRLRKHLKAAAARGVKVRVLTNSLQSTDAWWMYYASLNYYEELIRAGIEIYQYRGTETMHSKTMLIDDQLGVVGSFNLDPRSAVDNSESMLLIRDGDAVGELREALEADLGFADLASYETLTATDLAKARAFRLVEPLL